jgi:hypothetical protein
VILERPWDNPASRVTGELTALVGACVIVDWAARATGDRGQRFSCVGLHLARNYFILQNHSSIFAVFAERDFSQGPAFCTKKGPYLVSADVLANYRLRLTQQNGQE